MKSFKFCPIVSKVIIIGLLLAGCANDSEIPPTLPPVESWSIDFSNFETESKSAHIAITPSETTLSSNWAFAALVAGYFRSVMVVTLAVPVYSFQQAIHEPAQYQGDKTWEWSYTTTSMNNTYKARLTGQIRKDDVLWEMYLSQEGTGGFPEFRWFYGTSNLEVTQGQWILNQSYQYQEPVLQIDWKRTGTETGTVKYTYIRELNDTRLSDPLKNSYIEYGKITGNYDSYYNIHYFNGISFSDVNVEWNSVTKNGRVKCQAYFLDNQWHCWNNNLLNITCP